MTSYEGRPLPRPHEDVDDQGLAFDIATMTTRMTSRGSDAAAPWACSASAPPA